MYFDVVLGFRTVEFHPLWFCTSLIFITSTILSGTRFQALCRIYKSTSTKYARIFIHLNNLFIVIFGNLDKIVVRCQEDLLISCNKAKKMHPKRSVRPKGTPTIIVFVLGDTQLSWECLLCLARQSGGQSRI